MSRMSRNLIIAVAVIGTFTLNAASLERRSEPVTASQPAFTAVRSKLPDDEPPVCTVASLLTDYPRRSISELVFANKAGGRFLEIRGAFKNACERAGISDLHFHDLRHTFASQWDFQTRARSVRRAHVGPSRYIASASPDGSFVH